MNKNITHLSFYKIQRWYTNWHAQSFYSVIHWAIFILVAMILAMAIVADIDSIYYNPAQSIKFQRAYAQIGYLQSTKDSSSSSSRSVSFPGPTTAGNLIIVSVGWDNGTATAAVSDNQGNIYKSAVSPVTNGSLRAQIWYAENIKGGATTITVAFSSSVSNNIGIHEYSGIASSNSLGNTSFATGTGISPATAAVATAEAEVLLFGYSNHSTNVTWTAGQDYRLRQFMSRGASEDRTVFSPGSYNASFTTSAAGNWNVLLATFGASLGTPTPTPIPAPTPTPTSGDTTAPTVPRQVNTRAIRSDQVEIFWFDSMDNVGVTYKIYRANVLSWSNSVPATWTTPQVVGTATHSGLGQVGFANTGLAPNTDYIYWVSAVDPSGNESARSPQTITLVGAHNYPTTPPNGNVFEALASYPTSVAPGSSVAVSQTINCNPACTIGHHGLRFSTSIDNLPPDTDNFQIHSISDSTLATTRTSTATFTAPATSGNIYFVEDGHLGISPSWPSNGGGMSAHKEAMLYKILVTNGNPLVINPAILPSGSVGAAYSQILTATGEGSGSYSWGINEGRLPPGLMLAPKGILSGMPTQAGTYTFSIMVEDSQGTTSFRSYTITIQ